MRAAAVVTAIGALVCAALLLTDELSTSLGTEMPLPLDELEPDDGHAYRLRIDLGVPSDRYRNRTDDLSQVRITEDGVDLTPHAPHELIRVKGRGRFSHWSGGIHLSASDNSDPRTNGRDYVIVLPPTATADRRIAWMGLLGFGVVAAVSGLVWLAARGAARGPPAPDPRKGVRAAIWCAALLVLPEMGLRWMESSGVSSGGLPVRRETFLLLGTSRSMRALVPDVIEEGLVEAGRDAAWVANVSEQGLTMVGQYQRYMEEIRPRVDGDSPPGVLAVELRGSGVNDRYLADEEIAYVQRSSPELEQALGSAAPLGFVDSLLALDFDTAARALFSVLRLSDAGTIVDRWRLARSGFGPAWTRGDRGWATFPDGRHADLKQPIWEPRYRKRLLADYTLGGVQTTFLRQLVRQAAEDGWEVALYILPVTSIQRSFYAPGDLDRFLTHAARVAAEEDVPLLDLDTDHDLELTDFYDTHHLTAEAARRFSRTFADALARAR